MNIKKGFTLPEVIACIAFFSFIVIIVAIQSFNYSDYLRDVTTKTFLNSVYYGLTEDYYPTHGYYPASISADILPTVDQSLWDTATIYYEPANCTNNKCAEFTLRAPLIKESDFTKSNPTR